MMKITFKDIQRQNSKMKSVEVLVSDVGEPNPSVNGLCQAITATDDSGREVEMMYYFSNDTFRVRPEEVGVQFYDIKWNGKNNTFKCVPSEPETQDKKPDNKPDWDNIAFNKCRHNYKVKMLERMLPSELNENQKELDAIDELSLKDLRGRINNEETK